jgi:hypothetical protein
MWQTTPLKEISSWDSGMLWARSLDLEDKIWIDLKEMIKGIMKTTLYASTVLDNQGRLLIKEL